MLAIITHYVRRPAPPSPLSPFARLQMPGGVEIVEYEQKKKNAPNASAIMRVADWGVESWKIRSPLCKRRTAGSPHRRLDTVKNGCCQHHHHHWPTVSDGSVADVRLLIFPLSMDYDYVHHRAGLSGGMDGFVVFFL